MPYEALGVNPAGVKGSRWKDRAGEEGAEHCWTVASSFGLGRGEIKVTLILAKGAENTFYHKHVLRKGENAAKIHAVRNTRGALNQAMDHGGTAGEIRRAANRFAAAQNAMFLTGAQTSTFILLDSIDLKLMLYHMARKLASVSAQIATGGGNHDVEIDFDKGCVIDVPGHGRASDTIIVGAQKTADDGHRMTFDVNHCANNSAHYL